MGKFLGFMEYNRKTSPGESPLKRIKHFNEFHTPLSLEEQAEQGARCMECGTPFCQAGVMIKGMASGCPLNNLIPEWNDYVYQGNYEAALQRLRRTNNFPEFTSRVCPALCEKACTCSLNGDAVSVRENEKAIVEIGYQRGYIKAKKNIPLSGKKVAVIGSGPAGLTVADQLNMRGHKVTVFERFDRIGGLLRYGIPNMKLEKQIIDRRLAIMEEEGISFVCNANINTKKQADDILKEFHAVVLCCGASNPRDVSAEGRDAKGIYFAVDFLRSTTKALWDNGLKEGTYISAKGKNVIVIGGGDTGNDCVGTSIRHGAKSVTQIEMMPKPPQERTEDNPWPEWPRVGKTDYGQEESIAVFGKDPRIYETTVKRFHKDDKGNLVGVDIVKIARVFDEKTKSYGMKEVEGTLQTLPAEMVLIAAGFLGSQPDVAKAFGVDMDGRTNVSTAAGQYQTSKEKVFTAGDMHRGQSLVVWAIREGRDAARAVDESLMGYSNL